MTAAPIVGDGGNGHRPARTVAAIGRSARPGQWVKNLVVVAAPVASGTLLRRESFAPLALTVVAFCAAAGGTYLVNDLLDVDADRRHPRKRQRPIASGELGTSAARTAAVGLLLSGVLFGLAAGSVVAAVIVGYELLTLAYSRWLKHVALVDVCALAGGFVLRVVAGATATHLEVRASFIGAVFFGTMFVALTKRRGELRELGGEAADHRPVLRVYSEGVLSALLGGSLVGAMTSYGVWAMVRPGGEGGLWLDLSFVPLLVGVGRFTGLAWTGKAADPQRMVLHERAVALSAVATLILAATGAHAALT